jgi:hypothetical protein
MTEGDTIGSSYHPPQPWGLIYSFCIVIEDLDIGDRGISGKRVTQKELRVSGQLSWRSLVAIAKAVSYRSPHIELDIQRCNTCEMIS